MKALQTNVDATRELGFIRAPLDVQKYADLSIVQDLFHSLRGFKHTGQIRLDITNFGNMLNHNWGVGTRVINPQILTSPSADANGALTYNLQTLNGNLLTSPYQTTSALSDVYGLMLSFRYTFN